ncbi:hypothetical protein ACOSP7_013626 [Xanthoceras sorbifolium]
MAGNKQQKKFSIFSIFKSRRPRRGDDYNYAWEDSGRKIWPSDEDKGGYWFGEPGIDRKASAFIAKFHETRVSESERHAVYQGKA